MVIIHREIGEKKIEIFNIYIKYPTVIELPKNIWWKKYQSRENTTQYLHKQGNQKFWGKITQEESLTQTGCWYHVNSMD